MEAMLNLRHLRYSLDIAHLICSLRVKSKCMFVVSIYKNKLKAEVAVLASHKIDCKTKNWLLRRTFIVKRVNDDLHQVTVLLFLIFLLR